MGKGFWELFSDSFNEYGKKFFPILKVYTFLYLIPLIVLSILILILFAGISSSLGFSVLETGTLEFNEFFAQANTGAIATLIIGFIIFFPALIVLYFWTSISYVQIGLSNKEIPFRDTFAFARKNFWRYLSLTLLTIICLIPLFILLVIPGIIFLVFWTFASYILLSGNDGAWESMKKSKALVKGRWWRVFGYLLLIIVIVFVVDTILGIIPFVGSIISSLVLTPFMILFFKNFWIDLKGKKS